MNKDAKGSQPAAPEEVQAAAWEAAHIGESETHFRINYRYYLIKITNAQDPQTAAMGILSLKQYYGKAFSGTVTIPFNVENVHPRPETLRQQLGQITNFAAAGNLQQLDQLAPSNSLLVDFKARLGIPASEDEKAGPAVQPGFIVAQVTSIDRQGVTILTSGLRISLSCPVSEPSNNSRTSIKQVQQKMQVFDLELHPVDVHSINGPNQTPNPT